MSANGKRSGEEVTNPNPNHTDGVDLIQLHFKKYKLSL